MHFGTVLGPPGRPPVAPLHRLKGAKFGPFILPSFQNLSSCDLLCALYAIPGHVCIIVCSTRPWGLVHSLGRGAVLLRGSHKQPLWTVGSS